MIKRRIKSYLYYSPFFTGIIVLAIFGWWLTTKLIRDTPTPFLSLFESSDNARVIYETRSIASYATTLIISSAVVFIPLLTLIWGNAKQSISNTIDTLMSLLGNTSIDQKRLKKRIEDAHRAIKDINKLGIKYKPLFIFCIIFIILTLGYYLYVNFTKLEPIRCYRYVLILNGLSILIFGFLMFLFLIYQTKVRPKILLYEDRSSYEDIYTEDP